MLIFQLLEVENLMLSQNQKNKIWVFQILYSLIVFAVAIGLSLSET